MSVRRERRRDPKTGREREFWFVDIDIELPNGERRRVRKVSPANTRRDAERYEHELRRELIAGTYGQVEKRPVPTLADFETEFIENYAVVHNKPSEVESKR